jgi:protein-S-isoprenylcysteine O-methyltransferase Ste14
VNQVTLFDSLIVGWFVLAVVTFIALFFVTAPYGRHVRAGWGPTLSDKLAWVIMEAPAALAFAAFFVIGQETYTVAALVFLCLWELHYVYRAFIYPLRLRRSKRQMPISVVGLGFLFNVVNGYLNGRYLSTFSGGYTSEWLTDVRFVVGLGLFVGGYLINHQADRTLLKLRDRGEASYKIPQGGFYRWVSCPNYLGEIVEWLGWAVMTWSLSGLAFAVWTSANLAPRARTHHAWYRAEFPDYPAERKALVPGLW